MPFIYTSMSAQVATTFATHATPNTEVDTYFLKPGTRNAFIQALYVIGRGGGLTALSGLAFRFKKWTTTASSGGTAVTPAPNDVGMQACKATCGAASGGVTGGTGGPTFQGGIGCGAAGPGGWVAPNPDSVKTLEGSDNKSMDLYSASATASLNFEFTIEHGE